MSEPTKALLVIDRAIGTDQSQKFVYVVDDKNIVQYRAVKLGRLEDDGLRVVTEGLQPGDWVIVTGTPAGQARQAGEPAARGDAACRDQGRIATGGDDRRHASGKALTVAIA